MNEIIGPRRILWKKVKKKPDPDPPSTSLEDYSSTSKYNIDWGDHVLGTEEDYDYYSYKDLFWVEHSYGKIQNIYRSWKHPHVREWNHYCPYCGAKMYPDSFWKDFTICLKCDSGIFSAKDDYEIDCYMRDIKRNYPHYLC